MLYTLASTFGLCSTLLLLLLLQAQDAQMMFVFCYSEVKVMTRRLVLAFCCYQETPAQHWRFWDSLGWLSVDLSLSRRGIWRRVCGIQCAGVSTWRPFLLLLFIDPSSPSHCQGRGVISPVQVSSFAAPLSRPPPPLRQTHFSCLTSL